MKHKNKPTDKKRAGFAKPNKSSNTKIDGVWREDYKKPKERPKFATRKNTATDGSTLWLWGTHAVNAAIANEHRSVLEVLATRNGALNLLPNTKSTLVDADDLTDMLPPNSVHQGVAARVKPLPTPDYDKALEGSSGFVFVLDQLTDPQNIGAIFRTAAAFGAKAIIQQDRKAPPITGALAKAAQGGIETVADLRVVNISQTIKDLADLGYLTIGLAMDAPTTLAKTLEGETRPIAVVLGAEGKGLRQLVGERCEVLASIPIGKIMESLNVSNAAAISAYEICRK
jgi:23S rRNA (guanosine2251-2'-O)-methyltransferase